MNVDPIFIIQEDLCFLFVRFFLVLLLSRNTVG